MSCCYDVLLKCKLRDKSAAVKALQSFIATSTDANFCLSDYAKEGATPDTWEGLLRIIFAGWRECPFCIRQDENDFEVLTNAFNASYGWGQIMFDAFEAILPYLLDGSKLWLLSENDEYTMIVENGRIKHRAILA